MKLVSSAENSSLDWKAQYKYIEDIGDGRGYTAGIIGFSSGTGDMLDLDFPGDWARAAQDQEFQGAGVRHAAGGGTQRHEPGRHGPVGLPASGSSCVRGNLDLNPPRDWKVYGDSYHIG